MDIYVFHGVNEVEVAPLALNNFPHLLDSGVPLNGGGGIGEESFTSFNEVESSDPNFESSNPVIEHYSAPTKPSTLFSEPFNPSFQPSNPLVEPSNTSFQPSNPLTEPSNPYSQPPTPLDEPQTDEDLSGDESNDDSEVDSNEDSIDSDLHEEYRDFRASRRHFNRSNKRTRGTTTEQVHTGEKGTNIGYDKINVDSKDSLLGKLGGDEPYYPNDEAPRFALEKETGWGDG
ncbi:DNA-directed RNA polymerase II subunit RPB1-like [Solanum dulcamara]|uniref:DNA-directed RNA polymerase II subunit RPB1-like n=1 Tax=Solanum dulcamara TaxID=45834 RepID=UPI0024858DF6|nr:DNA-directed RNA polymerase II subunit RPB1-like [Solanum dulcamara]